MTIDFNDPAAVIAAYNAAYADCDQGPTGVCGATSVIAGMQARYLFANGVPMPQLSWPYAYFLATGDNTFTNNNPDATGGVPVWTQGICVGSLYSQEFVLANWHNGFPYPPSELPSQACYDNAPNQRVARFGAQVTDWFQAAQIIRSGVPIGFALGAHAVCAIAVSADGYWFYAKDSERANQNIGGAGRGVRMYSRDSLVAGAYGAFPIEEVYWSGLAAPAGEQPMTYEQINTAMQTGSWSSVQKSGFQSTSAAIVPADVPHVRVPPSASATDSQGHVWSLGNPSTIAGNRLVLRDGENWFGGQANLIDCDPLGTVKVQNSAGDWWMPIPSGWSATSAP